MNSEQASPPSGSLSRQHLSAALDLCVQSAWIADNQGMLLHANQRMCEQTRLPLGQMLGKSLSDLEWGARLLANSPDLFGAMLGDGPLEGTLGGRGGYTDGWERVTFKAVRDDEGTLVAVVGVHMDHEVEEEVPGEVIIMGDPSFGTPWIILMERLQQAIERASRKGKKMALLSLELIGLNNACNLGACQSESILGDVVGRIKKRLRRVDTIALVDHEQFIVVLEDLATADNLPVVGKRLLDEFSAPIEGSGERHEVSLSIGAACFPMNGETPDDLLERANGALNQARTEVSGLRFVLAPHQ